MATVPDPKLEADLHRKLRALPDRPAPATLAPRVLAAIHARARAWWRSAWWHWPPLAKAASLTLALLVASALGGGGWLLEQNVSTLSQHWTSRLPELSGFGTSVSAWTQQAAARASNVPQTVWLALLAVVVGMYLFCVGIGSAVVRLAVKRVPGNL